MSPQPRVVLVTGCSAGGIGSALCEEYASKGCKVYATARRAEAMDGLRQANVEKLVLDVTKENDVRDVVNTIIAREGRIDVLVNNAGVLTIGPTIEVGIETIERAYDANVFGVLRMSKAVIPNMAARKSGTIVMIGSIQADIPTPWAGIYGSTKAALRSLSDTLYMECTPLGISVLYVSTGSIRSNLSDNQAASFPGLSEHSLFSRYQPDMLRRMYASQGNHAMSSDEYARHVVGKSLQRKPPRYMSLGGLTGLYRVLMWVPRWIPLWLFWRHFSKGAAQK